MGTVPTNDTYTYPRESADGGRPSAASNKGMIGRNNLRGTTGAPREAVARFVLNQDGRKAALVVENAAAKPMRPFSRLLAQPRDRMVITADCRGSSPQRWKHHR